MGHRDTYTIDLQAQDFSAICYVCFFLSTFTTHPGPPAEQTQYPHSMMLSPLRFKDGVWLTPNI